MADGHATTDEVLAVLGRADDPELVEIVNLLAQVTGAEFTAISVLRGDDYHLHVTSGLEPLICAASDSLCIHTMSEHRNVVTSNAAKDVRFRKSPYVDGTLMSLRLYASAPLYEPGGQMVGRLCVFSPRQLTLSPLQLRTLDAFAASVTDIIELRLHRSEKKDRLPEGVLAAQVSHDMRAPLSAIMAALEILEDELGDTVNPTAKTLLERAQSAAKRLLTMTASVVEGDTAVRPQLREVRVSDVLDSVRADLDSLLSKGGAELDVQHLPIVMADPDQLYSVLLNLLSNSIKYSRPEVALKLHVWSRRVADRWRIYVADNGVGIDEDQREQVFGMFQRGTTQGEGHGVGLATVHRILAAHGGTVQIEETPGGGTTVWFDLPRTLAPLVPLPARQPAVRRTRHQTRLPLTEPPTG